MTQQILIVHDVFNKATNRWKGLQRFACLSLLATLAACSTRLDKAPVLDRSSLKGAVAQTVALTPAPAGYYRVKTGDTLYRIALEHGQNYRDLATWNNIQNSGQIEVGQLLHIAAPAVKAVPSEATEANPMTNSLVPRAQALDSSPALGDVALNAKPKSADASLPRTSPLTSANKLPIKQSAPVDTATEMAFAWPAQGPVLANFEEGKNKGIDIGGVAGAPVKAAADGHVVYAGNGLRGYGNLIIIKHNDQFLTAYAHNRALLVKENEAVTKNQKIAEMGNADAERVMLHFEIRQQGKPIDPLKYLPSPPSSPLKEPASKPKTEKSASPADSASARAVKP